MGFGAAGTVVRTTPQRDGSRAEPWPSYLYGVVQAGADSVPVFRYVIPDAILR